MKQTIEVDLKFWHWRQNNSGGYFDIDDDLGIGIDVWIQGTSYEDAVRRSSFLDENSSGWCHCCGERWSDPWDENGEDLSLEQLIEQLKDRKLHRGSIVSDHDTVYIHTIDGVIHRVVG